MKGQIFVITSILILLVLLLTRASTQTANVKQDESFYETFSNLKAELVKTVDLSLINQQSVSDNLDDFIDFSNQTLKKKGYALEVNYTVYPGQTTIVYLNVSLASSNSYLLDSLIINRTAYS